MRIFGNPVPESSLASAWCLSDLSDGGKETVSPYRLFSLPDAIKGESQLSSLCEQLHQVRLPFSAERHAPCTALQGLFPSQTKRPGRYNRVSSVRYWFLYIQAMPAKVPCVPPYIDIKAPL